MKSETTRTAKQDPKRRKSRPLKTNAREFAQKIIRQHPQAMKILR